MALDKQTVALSRELAECDREVARARDALREFAVRNPNFLGLAAKSIAEQAPLALQFLNHPDTRYPLVNHGFQAGVLRDTFEALRDYLAGIGAVLIKRTNLEAALDQGENDG